ncbi:FAD dependent oxidoreductase family protein [Mycobacterium xenopi 4042]|uniref:FAD dependent oxidoreductase family protein n=1 Tax=Mycobacterium xenopi 4042 TaxID=1299334 RepID=X8DJX3_MYCXE|nr:FAD dependent oxidoreductase family protein [Mycobacterium xenopi 4042]
MHELDSVDADAVVIANGIDAPTLWPACRSGGEGRGAAAALAQRLYAGAAAGDSGRVHSRQVYLVPRADGVVVGATQYEHGRDTAPVVSGVRDLLDDACAVLPALGEYELAECAAGFGR